MKFPPYETYVPSKLNWLDEIPSGWDVIPIKFGLKIPITDGPHETPEIFNEGIPFLSAESVKKDKLDFSHKRGFISLEEHKRFSKKYKPKRGDVYMVKSGATTGNMARVETDEEFNIWSPLAAMRPDNEMLTTDFLFFFMKSKSFFHSVELNWNYGTQQNIGMGVIANLQMALPPVDIQKKIAAFLEHKTQQIDRLINKKKTLIRKLEEQRIAVITQAVTKGIDENAKLKPSRVDWLGDVPEHWGLRRLKFLSNESLQYGANEAAEMDDRDQPRFIRITDVKADGTLHDETFRSIPADVAEPFILSEGDILMARSGATVGKTFIYSDDWGVAAYAGYLIRFRVDVELMEPNFAYLFFQTSTFWANINSTLIQSTIQNFSAEKYANILMPVPPKGEQEKILTHLNHILRKLDGMAKKVIEAIEKLEEYRSAIITSAVTGKIDVREIVVPKELQ